MVFGGGSTGATPEAPDAALFPIFMLSMISLIIVPATLCAPRVPHPDLDRKKKSVVSHNIREFFFLE